VVGDLISNKNNFNKIIRDLKIKKPQEGDIIREYFRNKDIGILHESYVDLDRVTSLRNKIGGQLVLCHPGKHGKLSVEFIKELRRAGVEGIEKLSPHHGYNTIMYIQHIARGQKLIETGGSDFHREEGSNMLIQNSWQYFKVDTSMLKGVNKIIG
jgi:predicted metal-dependent phosphoesterase TrpH